MTITQKSFTSVIFILLLWAPALLCAESQGEPAATEVKLIDQAGRILKPGPYKRIISLYGAHTENLFYLGLDEEIIGVSNDEIYPPEAQNKPAFNCNDSIEKFLAAQPDLVLMRPMHLASYGRLVQNLESYGITVAALQVNAADELYDYWRLLGRLTDRDAAAGKMISDFDQKISTISQSNINAEKKPGVFIESFHRGTKTYMENSLPIWILNLAGGRSVATDLTSPSNTIVAAFGLEKLLANQDRIDFYIIMSGPMNQTKPRDLEKLPAYRQIKDVKEKKVFLMEEYLLARPTPRLAEGLEKMIGILRNHDPDN